MAQETTVAVKINASTGGTESVKSLKAQIREATNEATMLAQKFGEFSPEAQKAAAKVADLRDQMEDFGLRVKGLNPDKFQRIADIGVGVARGLQAATGAMQLFGTESELAQQALLKVQAATAFAEGVQGIKDLDKNMGGFLSKTIQGFKGIKGAIAGTGIGLLIVALGTLVEYWDDIKIAVGAADTELKKANKAMKEAAQNTRTQTITLSYYGEVVNNTKKSETERKGALEQLKKLGIETDDINIANANSLDELNARIKVQTELIEKRARLEAITEILKEKTKKAIEEENKTVSDNIGWWDAIVVASTAATNITQTYQVAKNQSTVAEKKLNADRAKSQAEVNKYTELYRKELTGVSELEAKALETKNKVQSTLNLQKTAQDAANKATEDAITLQEELQRKSRELIDEAELIGKTEVEKEKTLALRKFNANIEGFKEGSKEFVAALKIYNDEIKAIDDEEAERKKKYQDDLNKSGLDSINKFYDAQILALKEKNAEQSIIDATETQRLEDLVNATNAIYGEGSQQEIDARLKLYDFKKGLSEKEEADIKKARDKKNEDDKKDIEKELAAIQQRYSAAIQGLTTLNDAYQAFSNRRLSIMDEQFAKEKMALDNSLKLNQITQADYEAQSLQMQKNFDAERNAAAKRAFDINKKVNLALAIMQTAQAVTAALTAGGNPIKLATGAQFVEAGIAAAVGAANIAKILATRFEGAGSAGYSVSAGGGGRGGAQPPQTTPLTGGTLPDTEAGQFAGMGRVYVLEGDITKTQTRVRRVRNVSVV